ncbi:acetylglucosaminyldiphospho-UDP acetyl-beta-D-mannosaminyltransferase [Candidatus Peregrinibacteria bacterium CG10_big_fil_rev_8_21_14_0_10_49_16]|nr:MAG: acetylglucosaminyldiphospho-UDP acetyl-beta-D-mannosaminyltransferase [Candidatus Peregrinibacteria bacterium CG10_big_fil_rev_8_21_14_0_10_49_16]
MPRISLLGIPIDALTQREAVRRIQKMCYSDTQHHVITPNSEMLVSASIHPDFFAVLQLSSLNIPDSAGLLWAARHTQQELPERVAGVDVVQELCSTLGEGVRVFLLGGKGGVGQRAGDVLLQKNPRLQVVGTYEGSPRSEDVEEIVQRVNVAQPTLLLVAFGAPQQDEWIATYLKEMPSVHVAMGVGGTFDFLAGKTKRSPLWMQRMGLEWLWRVVREPWRWRRVLNAIVVFPYLVLRHGRHPVSG